MLLAWHMMHELSHCLATVLWKRGLIKTHITPEHCVGFQWNGKAAAIYNPLIMRSECDREEAWGERGWYMEDKLGGHLHMIDDV